MALSTGPDIADLIADTEAEILRLVQDVDPSTAGVYEMCRYHLGLDGSGPSGKRMRPLLGLLAYASITGDHHRALPGAAAVELGHNFSLVHDDIEDHDLERRHRPALWAVHGIPQAINTGDMLFSLSRVALHRLTDLGFPDHTVLRLMRLYDTTCVALCEGQYLDIWMSEHDDALSVDLYFDMIGRKTAALIAASIEAGALLATSAGTSGSLSSSTTISSGSGATRPRPARSRRTSCGRRRRSRSSMPSSTPVPRPEHASPSSTDARRSTRARSWRPSGFSRPPVRATTRGTRPEATATGRWPSSTQPAWWTARLGSAWRESSSR
jgi:hypothetical protein